MQSAGVPIERYSFETVELMKDRVALASMRRELAVAQARLEGATPEEAEAKFPKIDLHVLDISFDQVRYPGERAFLKLQPTTFSLPADDADRLATSARELLRQPPEYQNYFQILNACRIDTPEVTPAI